MNQVPHSLPAPRSGHRGFSIIELMVSVVIGMLAIMFATKMITGGEQTRQNAMAGSDAMQNGMLAMFSISNDAAQAGYGLNDPLLVGCDTIFSDTGNYEMAQLGTVHPLAAAIIQSNGAKPDTISLYSGSSLVGTPMVRILADYAGGAYATVDRDPYGYDVNDVVVAVSDKSDVKCSLSQLSVKPVLGDDKKELRFEKTADTRFSTGSLPVSYDGGAARIFNLGPANKLSFHTWSINNGFLQLRATDMAGSGGTPATIADNIVSIKAQYGMDIRAGLAFTPEKGTTIGKWSATLSNPADPTEYQRIVALRLAVVARSKTPDRPAADGSCNATTVAPKVFATQEPNGVTAQPIDVDVAVAGDTVSWKCYRYRVFETIVPIRNAAWRPSAW